MQCFNYTAAVDLNDNRPVLFLHCFSDGAFRSYFRQ